MRMHSPPPLAFHGLTPAGTWPAPPEAAVTSSTFSATSSERRSAPAKPISSSARSRRPRAPSSQVASRRRSIGRVSAAAFCPWPPVAAQQSLQRLLDMAVPGIPRQIIEAMHLADGGEAAANGAARVALGEACQIGADRHRRTSPRSAASRPCRPVAWRPQRLGAPAPARAPAPPGPLRSVRPARRAGRRPAHLRRSLHPTGGGIRRTIRARRQGFERRGGRQAGKLHEARYPRLSRLDRHRDATGSRSVARAISRIADFGGWGAGEPPEAHASAAGR